MEGADGSVLLVDGDGSTLLFQPPTTPGGPYVDPAGDFSTLVKVSGVAFRRTLKDQTAYDFNARGQLASVRDRKKIELVMELVEWDPHEEYDRLGVEEKTMQIVGLDVPLSTVPVRRLLGSMKPSSPMMRPGGSSTPISLTRKRPLIV